MRGLLEKAAKKIDPPLRACSMLGNRDGGGSPTATTRNESRASVWSSEGLGQLLLDHATTLGLAAAAKNEPAGGCSKLSEDWISLILIIERLRERRQDARS